MAEQRSKHRTPYRFKAFNPGTGRISHGVMSAADENDLLLQLKAANMELVNFRSLGTKKSLLRKVAQKKVETREIIKAFIMLGRLLRTGVPLLGSLDKLTESISDPVLKAIVMEMKRDIADGMSMSEVMRNYPKVFSGTVLSIMSARENTGDIGDACEQIVEYLKWVDALTTRIKKSLRYPTMLIIALLLVVTIMMSFVVPTVIGFISELGRELPVATTSLMATSEFFQAHWWKLIGALIVIASFISTLRMASRAFRLKTDHILTIMPYFGELTVKLNTVKFLQTFAILFESGVPIMDSFDKASGSLQNLAFRDAFIVARNEIAAGKLISEAIAKTGYVSNTTCEMMSVGEESGRLGEIIKEITEFYNADIDDDVDRVVGMIEPAITVVLGLMITWIVAGVFGPIYESFESIR